MITKSLSINFYLGWVNKDTHKPNLPNLLQWAEAKSLLKKMFGNLFQRGPSQSDTSFCFFKK